jgi:hypothetical protein
MSEQAYAALQGQQAGRHVWAAIAEWRERPLPHGAPGEQALDHLLPAGALHSQPDEQRAGMGATPQL